MCATFGYSYTYPHTDWENEFYTGEGGLYPFRISTDSCSGGGVQNGQNFVLDVFDTNNDGFKDKIEDVCTRHDICYETIGKSRLTCDKTFRDHYQGECRNAFHYFWGRIPRHYCLISSLAAYEVVRAIGSDPYFNNQRTARKNLAQFAKYVVTENGVPYSVNKINSSHWGGDESPFGHVHFSQIDRINAEFYNQNGHYPSDQEFYEVVATAMVWPVNETNEEFPTLSPIFGTDDFYLEGVILIQKAAFSYIKSNI